MNTILKKVVFGIALALAGVVGAAGTGVQVTFSSKGPDVYPDGSEVVDGEYYALAWADDAAKLVMGTDGTVADGRVLAKVAVAEGHRCPPVNVKLDDETASACKDGVWGVFLLDTRGSTGDNMTISSATLIIRATVEIASNGFLSHTKLRSGLDLASLGTEVSDGFYQSGEYYADSTDFYITSLEGLKYFRDLVNGAEVASTNYVSRFGAPSERYETAEAVRSWHTGGPFSGRTVHLMTDIDLGNEEWEPIGHTRTELNLTISGVTKEITKLYFCGKFDGGIYDSNNELTGTHKISNLKVTYTGTPKKTNSTWAYFCGLFGWWNPMTSSDYFFKNLTIENVNIQGYNYCGAFFGGAVTTGDYTVDNLHLIGTININGRFSYIGGIAGDVRGNISNCTVEADGTGTIHGYYNVGGIAGYIGTTAQSGTTVSDSSVEDVAVTAYYDYNVGAIAGFANDVVISNNTVSAVAVSATVIEDNQMGLLVGASSATGDKYLVVADNTVVSSTASANGTPVTTQVGSATTEHSIVGSNVTFDESGKVTGGIFENIPVAAIADGYLTADNLDSETSADYPLTIGGPYVALIGTTPYSSLADAVAAVPANGVEATTITMNANTELDATVQIPANKKVVLDLNGKTVTTAYNGDPSGGRHYYAIDNYGMFTLEDSSDPSTGAIIARGIESFEGASMTMNGGTITACDANGGSPLWIEGGYVELNGGTLLSSAGSKYAAHIGNATVVVNDITVSGSNWNGVFYTVGSNLTVEDSDIDITCAYYLFYVDSGSTAVVNGGSYKKTGTNWESMICVGTEPSATVMTNTLTINNGTFELAPPADKQGVNPLILQWVDGGYARIVINGGTIIGTSQNLYKLHSGLQNSPEYAEVYITAGTFYTGNGVTAEVPSGTSATIAPGSVLSDKLTDGDGKTYYTVAAPMAAQIGDVKYRTFAEAIAAAEEYYTTNGSYPTVTVLNGATEQDNPDWKIADGQLVKKVYVAQIVSNAGATTNKYESLQAAVNAVCDETYSAETAITIALIADTEEKVTITEKSGLKLTITGSSDDEATYTKIKGAIRIAAASGVSTTDSLTIEKIHLVYSATCTSEQEGTYQGVPDCYEYFIKFTTSGIHNVTIRNCCINMDGQTAVDMTWGDTTGGSWNCGYGVHIGANLSPRGVKMSGVKASGLFELLYSSSVRGVTVENCVATEMSNGLWLRENLHNYDYESASSLGSIPCVISNNEIRVIGDYAATGIYLGTGCDATVELISNRIIYPGENVAALKCDQVNSAIISISGDDSLYDGGILSSTTGSGTITMSGGTVRGFVATSNNGFINITGGAVTGVVDGVAASIAISGGFYSEDPSAYVIDGYAAVALTEGEGYDAGYRFVVGKIATTDLEPAAGATDKEASYTFNVVVTDETGEIGTLATAKTIVVGVDDANSIADITLNDFNMSKVLASAVSAVGVNNENVTVDLRVSAAPTSGGTVAFEVHPEAVITVGAAEPEVVVLSNDDLADGATFSFKLYTGDAFAVGTFVKVTHKSSGYEDENFYVTVADDETGRYVPVTVSHFSTFEISEVTAEPGMVAINLNTGVQYESLSAAVADAGAGNTIMMLADDSVSLTNGQELEINKPLTITGPVDGNGDPLYTIYGTPSNTGFNDVFVASSSGTVTISNLAFAEFGNEAANSVNGHAPIFVSSGNNNVVLENLAISDFNRTAIKINGGEFLVKDCYIDCDTDVTNYRVGGIDIANAATGAIVGTTIVNVDTSNPTDWVAAALEIIGSGDILVEDCSITSSMYGIFVSTAAGTSPGSSAVTVVDTTIDADVYSLINDSDSADAEIAVESGSYTGMLYAETETGLSISGGSFDDEIPEEYCADGYIPAEQDPVTGMYTVKTGSYVAAVYDTNDDLVGKYETLAAAIDAANSGYTVVLLTDIVDVAIEDGGSAAFTITKSLTIDGDGYSIIGAANSSPRDVISAWSGPRIMFDVNTPSIDVNFYNIVLNGGQSHYYSFLVRAKSGTVTFGDVTLVHGGEADESGEPGAGYGAAVQVDGAEVIVCGDFIADSCGETDGIFPFTALLYQSGEIAFDDGVTADIGGDLLLVGKEGSVDVSTPEGKEEVQAWLDEMNVPDQFLPYTLTLGDGSAYAFTGASPLGWNDIIAYGKGIMDVSTALGYEGLDKNTTPVEVGLLTDTVLPDTFTFEDSNFTVNGNGNALSGTIEYTDTAGKIENIEMGVDGGEALILDMTGVTKPIELGSGVAASNVVIKMTAEQATQGTPVVIWDVDNGVTAPENEEGVAVVLVDGTSGDPVIDESTGEPKTASLEWDDELGMAYIGPCEARLFGPSHEAPIYTSLASAIEQAEDSGDTVTLLMDISNFAGTIDINKSLTLDGAGHSITAAPVPVDGHRDVVHAWSGSTTMFKLQTGDITFRNITLDGHATHAYTFLISADNSSITLTTENIRLLNGGELCGDSNGAVISAGAGYGAGIHLNNGAALTVKDGFYACTGGPDDGCFPFTGILPENLDAGTSVTFDLTDDSDANPMVDIGSDLLLVGMVGDLIGEYGIGTVQSMLDYMKVPQRFIPYTLTLDDGSAYAFTGASPLGWNDIIDYGKEIMDVSTNIGYEGLNKETTPVEVGLVTDTVLPDTFTFEDSNFTVNGNGNALSGTIKYTDDAGTIENIELGKEGSGSQLVLDLRQVTDPVVLGSGVAAVNVTILLTEDQTALGTPIFVWDGDAPEGTDNVSIQVFEDATSVDPIAGENAGLVWDDEFDVAYIGPCEARLSGPARTEPLYTTLSNAFANACGDETITLFSADAPLNMVVGLPPGDLMFSKGAYSGFAAGASAGFAITNLTTVFRSDMDLADMMSVEDGWMLSVKTDGTTNIYSAVVRGNYHVVLTAVGGSETNAVVNVSDAWVAANVPSAQTVQDVEAKLEEVDPDMGMKRWQAYVLNRDSALAVTAVSDAGKVTISLEEPIADAGLTVTYSLDRVSKTGADVSAGTESDDRTDVGSIDFSSLAEGEYGLYKVRVHFTTPEGSSIAEATNTVGVLRASSASQLSVVSVPWGSLADGGAVKVLDYLRGSGISAGDMLFSYNAAQGVYDAWKYESGAWVSQITYKVDFEGGMGSSESPLPDVKRLERGSGVWLKRGDSAGSGPVCMVGLYVTNRVQTVLGDGYNLVAPPTAEAVSLNTLFPNPGTGDTVMVPTDGAPKTYTFENGSWGYSSAEEQQVTFAGRTITVAVPVRVTNVTVPAGQGFWYVNGGNTGSIEW